MQQENPLLKNIDTNTSVRYQFVDQGRLLNVVNPLVNTKSCSTAECHAHPESIAVLGALEVKLPLEGLRTQIRHTATRDVHICFSALCPDLDDYRPGSNSFRDEAPEET